MTACAVYRTSCLFYFGTHLNERRFRVKIQLIQMYEMTKRLSVMAAVTDVPSPLSVVRGPNDR